MAYEFLWGCELNAKNKEYEWAGEDNCNTDISFSLLLRHAVLGCGEDVDETHVVDLETQSYVGETLRQPLVILKSGKMQQTQLDILVTHVGSKLILVKGSGPVYFWGQRIVDSNHITELTNPGSATYGSSGSFRHRRIRRDNFLKSAAELVDLDNANVCFDNSSLLQPSDTESPLKELLSSTVRQLQLVDAVAAVPTSKRLFSTAEAPTTAEDDTKTDAGVKQSPMQTRNLRKRKGKTSGT